MDYRYSSETGWVRDEVVISVRYYKLVKAPDYNIAQDSSGAARLFFLTASDTYHTEMQLGAARLLFVTV
jgi:hypothetical protein